MIDNIDIDLDDIDEYLNDYDDDKINVELVDYIMESINDLNKDIVFNVNFKYKGNKDKVDKVKEKIDITFKDLNEQNEFILKKNSYRIIFLFILGLIFFGLSNLFLIFNVSIISEFSKILCWFSITYFAVELFFTRRKLIRIKKKYERIFNAKINVISK